MHVAAHNGPWARATASDARWAAVVARDPQADGPFYDSVETTGVSCRPSCAARLARPEPVRFHATYEEAERAGFRPCKHCQPNQASPVEQHATTIAAVCRRIEKSEAMPSLAPLARHAGCSPSYFHRVFKAVTGLTPQAYAAAQHAKRVRNQLGTSPTVTEALYNAGYNSHGRFDATSDAILGMTPSQYRTGGAHMAIRCAIGACSLGSLLVATSDRGMCAMLLGDDPDARARDLQDQFPRATLIGGDAATAQRVATVVGFVEAPGMGLHVPLDVRGTAFQQRVWQALREIPAGKTASSTDIAHRIGSPHAVRAVAQACAAHALAVAMPCHRVVRHDGGLSGYRWGVERKRALLGKEAHTCMHR